MRRNLLVHPLLCRLVFLDKTTISRYIVSGYSIERRLFNAMSSKQSYRRVTIADVANHAGVSTATVSRVLNSSDNVSSKNRTLVQAAIDELGYVPSAAARVLASQKTNTIGLIVDEIIGEYFPPMLRGIEIATSQAGYDMLINCTRLTGKAKHYPVGEHNTDGVIVFPGSLPDAELKRLNRANFPIVLLHRSPPEGLKMPCVTIENKFGARQMVDYLIEQRGYRRIAFLTGPGGHEDSFWRMRGYEESLEAHGIDFDSTLIGHGGFDEEQARETVTQWIRRGMQIDAIFAGDDDSAIGSMVAIRDAGLSVPDDIAVVGFDDIRLARYLDPPLTTVRAPIEEAARTAVEQLISLINTGDAEELILLKTELIIRNSCGFDSSKTSQKDAM
jgi:LacI family transcriptional regulator